MRIPTESELDRALEIMDDMLTLELAAYAITVAKLMKLDQFFLGAADPRTSFTTAFMLGMVVAELQSGAQK